MLDCLKGLSAMKREDCLDRPTEDVPTVDSAPEAVISGERRDGRVMGDDRSSHRRFHWLYEDLLS